MSVTKLFLFTKDTDASATDQGFHYQKLKTLKTWLENRVNEVDDVIYCDYEDDIFERNIEQGKSKFRQVKLYSSNFSFSKEEIQKSLVHFFMLFIKGDYMFDNVLVILDNGGWRNYNFENLFLGTGTGSVLNRTQKIFYVCCTRAKEKLTVFYHHPSAAVIAKAGGMVRC